MPKYQIIIEDSMNQTEDTSYPYDVMINIAAGLEQFLPYIATGKMTITVWKDGEKIHG